MEKVKLGDQKKSISCGTLTFMFSRFPRFYSPNLLPDSLEFNFYFCIFNIRRAQSSTREKDFLSDVAFELFHWSLFFIKNTIISQIRYNLVILEYSCISNFVELKSRNFELLKFILLNTRNNHFSISAFEKLSYLKKHWSNCNFLVYLKRFFWSY